MVKSGTSCIIVILIFSVISGCANTSSEKPLVFEPENQWSQLAGHIGNRVQGILTSNTSYDWFNRRNRQNIHYRVAIIHRGMEPELITELNKYFGFYIGKNIREIYACENPTKICHDLDIEVVADELQLKSASEVYSSERVEDDSDPNGIIGIFKHPEDGKINITFLHLKAESDSGSHLTGELNTNFSHESGHLKGEGAKLVYADLVYGTGVFCDGRKYEHTRYLDNEIHRTNFENRAKEVCTTVLKGSIKDGEKVLCYGSANQQYELVPSNYVLEQADSCKPVYEFMIRKI